MKKVKKKPAALFENTSEALELPKELPDISINTGNKQGDNKLENDNAPLGNLDLEGVDADLNDDDDFDLEDVQIQDKKANNKLNKSEESDYF